MTDVIVVGGGHNGLTTGVVVPRERWGQAIGSLEPSAIDVLNAVQGG